jgi:hypothetical protein
MSGSQFADVGRKGGKLSVEERERLVAYLRKRFPAKTAACVEAETGVPADTFRKWESGSAPSFESFVLLIHWGGPEFMSAVFPSLLWIGESALLARANRLRDELAAVEQRITDFHSTR